jgi:hypothetical protein
MSPLSFESNDSSGGCAVEGQSFNTTYQRFRLISGLIITFARR